MEKWKKRAVDLVTSLAFGSRGDPTVVEYYPQKIQINSPEEPFFRRSNPEKWGISSKRIYDMLCELERERRANMHNLMVLCGGEVICECSADGYGVNSAHVSHSMSKTVCGMVIGTLADEGRLRVDEKIIDLLPEYRYRDKKFAQITVEHLLSMTGGVDFAEAGAITESRWTEAFFSAVVKFPPGTRFAYNSMNTYLLARISERVTGKSFGCLARERIFNPLFIENYFWEKGPEGTEKAGWGLYMSAESWAKVGYMLLRGGEFYGRRILSESWAKISSSVKAIVPEGDGGFNYAYQMWVSRSNDEILFNGMLGQNVWICPQNDIVVVMQGGNNELFQSSPALEIIRNHLGGEIRDSIDQKDVYLLRKKEAEFFDCRRWVRPKERNRSILCLLGIKPATVFDEAWSAILGNYIFGINDVGILPYIVRAMQNSLNSRIEEMTFAKNGDRLCLIIRESGEILRISVGFYAYETSVVDIRGEKYIVKAMADVARENDGEREFRIELIFSETASKRMLKIKRVGTGKIKINFSEVPNNKIVESFLGRYCEESQTVGFAVELLERRFGRETVASTIKRRFNPTLVGANTAFRGYRKIIKEENRRADEEMNRVRFVRVVVDRLFKEPVYDKKTSTEAP